MTLLSILVEYQEAFIDGLKTTLAMALITWTSGIIGGILVGFLASYFEKTIGSCLRLIAFILSGLPVLVPLLVLHYPAQANANIRVNPFYTASLVFSLVNIVVVGICTFQAIKDFPRQFIAVAKISGLSPLQIFRYIQLPLLLRSLIPTLLFIQVAALHLTIVASWISVDDLFRQAQRITMKTFHPIEVYSVVGGFFLVICLPLNAFALILRNKYTRELSER
ncbi:ABC transporter permease subunit [bacterium]|nr:ABC transporter permease subunit [bacterium]